ncbi:MAG: hypothetical protein IPL11_02305, partial [Candidatus Accumulibacter sp.]|nr:hypothetical protein [Accumulibacter sp.]
MPAVRLLADDAVHEALTEWWYYSGHLQTDSGERYAFHMAVFSCAAARSPIRYSEAPCSTIRPSRSTPSRRRTAGNLSDGPTNGFGFQLRQLARGEQAPSTRRKWRARISRPTRNLRSRCNRCCNRHRGFRPSGFVLISAAPARAITRRVRAWLPRDIEYWWNNQGGTGGEVWSGSPVGRFSK